MAPLAIGALATGGADLAALPGLFGADAAVDAGAAGIAGETVAGGADIFGDAGILGETAATGATAGGDALSGIDAAIGATGGTLPGNALAFTGDTVGAGGAEGGGGLASAVSGGTTVGTGGAGGGIDAGAGGIAGQTVGPAGDTGGGIWDTIAKGATSAFTKNPIGTTLGVAGVAGSLYGGVEQKLAANKLNAQEQANVTNANNIAAQAQSIAAPLINQGQTLTSYLSSGTLPPQFQTQVDQSIATQKAGIIQGYASRGMSTNPQQNSQLQQDLAAVDNSRNTLMTQLESQLSTAGTNMINTANQMLAQGLAATQLESEIPIQMSKLNEQLNKDMMTSISNFAAAMNGGKFTSTTQAAAA